MVLGSFFWGYLASQIPAGWLATRIGGKWLFGVAMLVAALLTIITPVVAENTFVGLMVVRILLGAASVSELRVLLEWACACACWRSWQFLCRGVQWCE